MLNDLIIIEKRKNSSNSYGFEESIWEKELSCWADKERKTSVDHYSAQSHRTQIETTYKIRKSQKTKNMDTSNYRIIHKGEIHDIKSIIEDGQKGEFLKIECKMVS
ncbi:MAG: phage head closure protein [Paraclostridium sp.]